METSVNKSAGPLTKSQQACNILREMIISKEFSSGNNWSLRKLAVRLKMSVVPIAEGLRRLEQEGILEVRPQRGITVRQLSAREQDELMIIREALEVQAARILAIFRPARKIKQLQQLARKIQSQLKAGRFNQAAVTDFQLHRQMVEAANSPLLTERYNQLITLSMINSDGLYTNWLQAELSGHSNHVHLVDMIASGDPAVADRAIREHIRTGADQDLVHP
jgi:DNA-binding GntR family transcriptional regulator